MMDVFGLVVLLLFVTCVLAFICVCRSDADLSLMTCLKFRRSKLNDLRGRVVWVTGASSGIGAAVAEEAAARGARVALSARDIRKLEEVRQKCIDCGRRFGMGAADYFVLPMNVVDFDGHQNRVNKVLQHFGKISILFLCAGRSQRAPWESISPEVDREILDVNTVAAANLARKVLPHFHKQGGGSFAVVSSLAGKTGVPFMSSVSASKFALHGYFESLRLESGGSGVSVTMLCPGPTFSNILASAATDSPGQSLGGEMSSDENRLKPDRVALLSLAAVVNKIEEAWIAPFPFLPMLYFNQYMPTITKRLAVFLGRKYMEKAKES